MHGGFDAIADLKFLHHVGHVMLDGLFAELQPLGDFLVG
jgi:hypothetical protein